jgi:hypothetical protein
VVAAGAVAYAQDDEGEGWPFNFHQRFKEVLAGKLGVTVTEYDAAVEQAQGEVVDEALAEGWLTENQAERMRERMDQGFGLRGRGKGLMGPHAGPLGRAGGSIIGKVAEELDMSARELMAELQEGKSIAEVAEEQGVDLQPVIDAYLEKIAERLQQAVEDGKITQKQADWMLEQAGKMIADQLDKSWEGRVPGGFRGCPGGGRPGRMRDFPGSNDA